MTLVKKIKVRDFRSTLEKREGERIVLNDSFLTVRSAGTVRFGQINADSMNAIANIFTLISDDTMTLCWNDMKLTFVKNDDIASKEFNRIAALMKLIGKADAIYSSGINRYCELFSEIEKLKASKARPETIADELNEKFEQLEDLEYDDIMDFGKMYTKMLGESMKVDSAIMSKRKMMSDIEKENGWTVLSALRAVPKAPQKDENADVLAKLLAE